MDTLTQDLILDAIKKDTNLLTKFPELPIEIYANNVKLFYVAEWEGSKKWWHIRNITNRKFLAEMCVICYTHMLDVKIRTSEETFKIRIYRDNEI